MTRNNPNKPARKSRRNKVRGSTVAKVRGAPTAPKVDSKGFIRPGSGVSKKKERKKLRNAQYAKTRELEQQELQRLIETGEVEMKDTTLETMSKTQKKKLERLEAAAAAAENSGLEEDGGEGDDVNMVVE